MVLTKPDQLKISLLMRKNRKMATEKLIGTAEWYNELTGCVRPDGTQSCSRVQVQLSQ